ncbi:histidine phosphatase family protein [Reichenbachiella sp. MALMAid0571]|uniref:SixA phosphatase family protein n=1 Tax=Reichenbachiella sp. MALMAid0571 TaxID=3143939 RepID=UPI0032DF462C
MSKQLFLIRHAQAEGMQSDIKDIDRILTNEGCRDAMRMGKLLSEEGHTPDLVLSSTAERTRETTRYLCEQLNYDFEKVIFTEDLYESSVRLMLSTINKVADQHKTLFVIAHNPSISYLGESLTGDPTGNMPPCGVLYLKSSTGSWQEISQNSCSLKKFYDPIDL